MARRRNPNPNAMSYLRVERIDKYNKSFMRVTLALSYESLDEQFKQEEESHYIEGWGPNNKSKETWFAYLRRVGLIPAHAKSLTIVPLDGSYYRGVEAAWYGGFKK